MEDVVTYSASQEIILKLKAIKKDHELTLPRIQDLIEKNGEFVSMSSLRRVFAAGSENESFSYERTIIPIARALLLKTDEEDADKIEELRAVLMIKNEEIERLHEINKHLEQRVTFLLEQIEKKDRRMDERDEIIKRLMDKVL